jgi:branched-subunit amino acid transport protein
MSAAWIVVAAVGAATVLFKGAGPVFLGHRELPPRALGLVEVLAPAMLAALVVTQLVGGDQELVLDGPRLLGVAGAGVALWLRAPLIVVIVVAGAVAGLVRLVT